MSDEVKVKRSRLFPRLIIFLAVVGLGLVVASAAFAAWTTINTNNGLVDGAWGTATYTEGCSDQPSRQADDLQSAWVRYDGTMLYFRVKMCASPALSSGKLRAIAAIDCNNNGSFDEPANNGPAGDRRIVYYADSGAVWVFDGQNNPVIQYGATYSELVGTDVEWSAPIQALYPACRASASSVSLAWVIADTTTTPATVMDQSDTVYSLYNPMDFGDTNNPGATPSSCQTGGVGNPQTLLQCDGARHGALPLTPGAEPLRLGADTIDGDAGNLNNANSNADDMTGVDDEGGIAPSSTSWKGTTSATLTFSIVGASAVRMGCWIDFNKNGNWTDTGEAVISSGTIGSSTTSRAITIPGDLTFPNSFPARCRVWPNPTTGTPAPAVVPYGAYEFGEVEDHLWEFNTDGFYAPRITDLAIAPSGADAKLTWTNPASNDSARVLSHETNPYFDPTDAGAQDRGVVANPTAEFIETGALGDTNVQTIYYIALGRIGVVEADPSNRVGLFEFGLIPGGLP